MTISSFEGFNEFLSNFYSCEVEFEGRTYPSVEHAYQAAKSVKPDIRRRMAEMATPGKAKRFGNRIELRQGWDSMRTEVMMKVLRSKFSDPELAQCLLDTGTEELIEGNNWGDTFWGVCNSKGENNLGRLLMQLREEIQSR